jgi:hypothetical protein
MLFSGCFTFGVTHEENDSVLDVVLRLGLSLLLGCFMMPVYLGSWLDLNNKQNDRNKS